MDDTNKTCREFVSALASSAPTPGGGGAAALCGAVGAALSYVAGLTLQAPHGGLFVIFLCNKPVVFLLILALASAITAGMLLLFRPKTLPAEEDEEEMLQINI